jgi:hypothetical protein
MRNADKTCCPKDHPYDEANTYVGKQSVKAGGGVRRQCKKCQRALEIRCRAAARKRRLAAAALLLCSCSAWEAMKDPLTVTAAAAGGAVVAGPAGAAVAAGAAAATLDIADATKGEEAAVAKVDAITMAALTGELAPLQSALATEAAERSGLSAAMDELKFWVIAGAIGWGVFYLLRHIKEVLAFLRFLKIIPKKDA